MARPKKVVSDAPAAKSRTLLLTVAGVETRIMIPSDSRITFGPTIPYTKKDNGYSSQRHGGYSLRVYDGVSKDNLIAVFAGVESFRDSSISVEKLVIRESGKSVWKSDEEGYKVENEVKREASWSNLSQLQLEGS